LVEHLARPRCSGGGVGEIKFPGIRRCAGIGPRGCVDEDDSPIVEDNSLGIWAAIGTTLSRALSRGFETTHETTAGGLGVETRREQKPVAGKATPGCHFPHQPTE
jgi:hypothetical protein